jgi:hypothetical protein
VIGLICLILNNLHNLRLQTSELDKCSLAVDTTISGKPVNSIEAFISSATLVLNYYTTHCGSKVLGLIFLKIEDTLGRQTTFFYSK